MSEITMAADAAQDQARMEFERVVAREVDFVYSCALRQVGDPGLAEDVTQAVFLILWRKWGRVPAGRVLEGWLHQTTRYAARNAMRARARREHYERAAAKEAAAGSESSREWEELALLLDEAVASLGGADRDCVLLRYFQKKSYGEIALAVGSSEAAARKRTERAVEKLRGFFARRGVVCGAEALGACIVAHAVNAAPSHLAAAVGSGSSGAIAIAQGAARAMLVAQAKVVVAWALAATVLLGAGGVAVQALRGGGTTTRVATNAGKKIVELSIGGTRGAAVSGFYVSGGERHEILTVAPITARLEGASLVMLRKANAADLLAVTARGGDGMISVTAPPHVAGGVSLDLEGGYSGQWLSEKEALALPESDLLSLHIRRVEGEWVIDEPRLGMAGAPLGNGAGALVETLMDGRAHRGALRLAVSSRAFAGAQRRLVRVGGEGAPRYRVDDRAAMEVGMGPEFFRFFASVPEQLFVRAEAEEGRAATAASSPSTRP